ncbi:hypothetical protein TBLA_0E02180 [Henningerozyma blattae CBS 6284]|uniref:Glutamate--tRNA ligase, mitochondrial n=1 Tax=Henningerozyma blattae (strain ATCC 34711 / CBS 6284 / DSM 70876 / NBRC 10599 / NRRL Y-10934 / UCD 77-7) TaxID=1071380 RepID=I2H4G9_HENB6|nr:hypothetical protein TBLA_0E02180 [Tetrapisispora blattae CBS 6284]CCH61271.1 hypothetical protein TBLA_0E02180 [Tetrapisispora blattae CBS 6284]
MVGNMLLRQKRLFSLSKIWRKDLIFSSDFLNFTQAENIHPNFPVRTRFAPSPTGSLHLGSLRTALYNYLLARNTGGQFILRIEDTDQKRLVKGAEENIYSSLKWLGLQFDEGPNGINGPYGPYKQSERSSIYQKYINELLDNGKAYRCFCSKERLTGLKESAQKLKPPTTASYDRKCTNLTKSQIEENLKNKVPYTVRLLSPDLYPAFEDLLHGKLNIQPQYNSIDRRFDDPVLMKSDNLPTYHFANVVDDHLMKISHVIRGEEWLPSTPKHIAIYEAFGWKPPKYIHIPLLTTLNDKKLSKRKGSASILQLKEDGVLPEALINFSVLFGWCPPRELTSTNHECFTLREFENIFDLRYLTKGNAKVDEKKLWFFNKHYLTKRLESDNGLTELALQVLPLFKEKFGSSVTIERLTKVLDISKGNLTTIFESISKLDYFFEKPLYEKYQELAIDNTEMKTILDYIYTNLEESNIMMLINTLHSESMIPKKNIFKTVRFALSGPKSGAKIHDIITILGKIESKLRIQDLAKYIK